MIRFATKDATIMFMKSAGLTINPDGETFSMNESLTLGHGEYDKPDYQPREYADGWGIHAKYYCYKGAVDAPQDGRISAADWLTPDGQWISPEQIPY